MCPDCFLANIYRFSSEQDYLQLEIAVWNKVKQGPLRELKIEPATTQYQHDISFQCQTCREIWLLSAPDNAWRGYLLSQDAATAYGRKLRWIDRKKAVIGIGSLLAFGAAILWGMLR